MSSSGMTCRVPSIIRNGIFIFQFYNAFLVEFTIASKISYGSDVFSEDGTAKCETFVYNPDTNLLECPTTYEPSSPTNNRYKEIDLDLLNFAHLFILTLIFVIAVFGVMIVCKCASLCHTSWKRRRDSGVETYQQFECPEPVGINTVSNNVGFNNPSFDGNNVSLSTPDVISIGPTPTQYQDALPPGYQSPPSYNQCVADENDSHHRNNQSVSDKTRIIPRD
ncbi:unnamed protein product [Orchesella dallaii]|uniref:Uncharacterized protein n=1 Tax=Orchesella dallaii TaxID=48710 RepID=A0ABP1S7Z7_9HEXA